MVDWQLPKRQAGTHEVKNRAEIATDRKKMYRQKGSGRPAMAPRARQHLPWRRSGVRSGLRSHAIELPKKVRALALKHALSAKAKAARIVVVDKVGLSEGKTKALRSRLRSSDFPMR